MYLAYIPSFSVMDLGNSLNSILLMVKDVWNHLYKLISKFFCSQRRFGMIIMMHQKKPQLQLQKDS